jgi:hypothetical protein
VISTIHHDHVSTPPAPAAAHCQSAGGDSESPALRPGRDLELNLIIESCLCIKGQNRRDRACESGGIGLSERIGFGMGKGRPGHQW